MIASGKHEATELDALQKDMAHDAQDALKIQTGTELQVQKGNLQAQKDGLQQQVDAGQITAEQKAETEMKLVDQLADIDQRILRNEASLNANSFAQAAQMNRQEILTAQQASTQKVAIATAEANRKAEIARVAADKEIDTERRVAASAAQTVSSLIEGRQTFAQVASTIGDRLVTKAIEWGIEELVAKKAIQKDEVLLDAKAAAAAASKAVYGIPVIGPFLAPAAGAAAFVAVEAFSAAGGADRVPYDDAPFLLHRNEMVLPAGLANNVRNMTTTNSGGNLTLGDIHIHQQPGQNSDDMYRGFMSRLRNDHRNGAVRFA